jgi:hypothetical protein
MWRAAGAVCELLNEDRRTALEIIVDERAEATDPETADDVPDDDAAAVRRKDQ